MLATIGAGPDPATRMPFDVIVVMDPIERIKIAKDSTFAMLLEARRRGHRLWYVRPGGLSVADGRAAAQAPRLLELRWGKKGGKRVTLVEKPNVLRETGGLMTRIFRDLAKQYPGIQADEANIERARLDREFCTITAPISGRTGDLIVKAGNLVKASDDRALVVVNQMRPIYVVFTATAEFLPEFVNRPAGSVKVIARPPADGAEPHEGVLTFMDNVIDRGASTVMLKATFPNEREALWPGLFVDVLVVLRDEPDRVVVPTTAVQTGQEGQFVVVSKSDATVELRPVTVARMVDQESVIERGLEPGERVVSDAEFRRLVPGGRVEVKAGLVPAAAPAGGEDGAE